MADVVTMAEGARSFLSTLSTGDRQSYSQEVNRFTRWYGADKLFSNLGSLDVELYGAELDASRADSSLRAEAVKSFLLYAKQQGWLTSNLATLIRVRKTGGRKISKSEQRPAQQAVHLTFEGYQKIKNELEELIKERPKIADELKRARADKDFRENAPLDAARQQQAQVEGRIQQLEATLKVAVIIRDEHVSDTKVGLGSRVVLWDLGYDEEITYTLVSPNEVDLKKGKISVASPTGKAILDKQVGDEIEVMAPVGALKYRVERVEK